MVLAFFRQALVDSPYVADFVMYLYFISLLILFTFGAHGFVMVYHYLKQKNLRRRNPALEHEPTVTVQLPIFNEVYVVRRLIDAVCRLDYPREKLEVQVLDDSTDETVSIVEEATAHYQALGCDVKHIRRTDRRGFKAGALKHGLSTARGEFIAIFDADFVPRREFLKKTLPYFQEPRV
jgi:cellulose synthase/poly-beta-1,6-N-acetylglucosamine synthase-like glycosyltransferase